MSGITIPPEFIELSKAGKVRFIKVKKGQKKPLGKWSTSANYAHDDPEFIRHLSRGNNYGYMVKGSLCVLDADSPEHLTDLITLLGDTLVVKSGRDGEGYHILFECDDIGQDKIYLKYWDTDKNSHDIGDIRPGDSPFYVVGPGSIHPSGKPYEIVNHSPVRRLDPDPLKELLKKYTEEPKRDNNPSNDTVKRAFAVLDGSKVFKRRKQPEPGRNVYLFKYGCSLRSKGLSDSTIGYELIQVNQNDCIPPLDDSEVRGIITSVCCFPPGHDPKAETHHPNEISEEELNEHDNRVSINDLKFSINVPPDHFISKYVAHMVDKTDAYSDYHYAAALTLLSIAANRTVFTHIKNTGNIYTNLWLMCLGQSSFSRKSTALNTVKIIAGANIDFKSCPGMFSTEGLVEAFSDNPRSYLVKDECAQILGSINKKQYMSDVRDVLCELYDCGDIKRKLRTSKKNDRSEYEITDSYPVFLCATTPDNFFMNTTRLDLTSGWLIRFLYVFPRYKKDIKGLELGTEQDKLNLAEIGTAFNHIAGNVSAFESVHIHPSEEALSRFNAWFIKKQERLESSEEDNSLTSTVFARILITALKIAALLTLGDSRCKDQFKDNGVDFSSKIQDIEQNENPNIEILIPDEFMTESMRLVDEYFLPMALDIIEDLISREDENIQGRILQFLKNSPKRRLTRSELLRKVKLTSKVFDEHIHTLVYDREEIAETVINESGKPKVLYLLKKGKELNKSLFEFN